MEKKKTKYKIKKTEIPEFDLSPKIEKLQKQVDKNPGSTVFFQLAAEYRKSNMAEEAVFVLEAGLEHNPTFLQAKLLLAQCFIDLNENMKAKQIVDQVLSSNMNNPVALKLGADLAYVTGDYNEARDLYEKAHAINPMFEKVNERLRELRSGGDVKKIELSEMKPDEEMHVELGSQHAKVTEESEEVEEDPWSVSGPPPEEAGEEASDFVTQHEAPPEFEVAHPQQIDYSQQQIQQPVQESYTPQVPEYQQQPYTEQIPYQQPIPQPVEPQGFDEGVPFVSREVSIPQPSYQPEFEQPVPSQQPFEPQYEQSAYEQVEMDYNPADVLPGVDTFSQTPQQPYESEPVVPVQQEYQFQQMPDNMGSGIDEQPSFQDQFEINDSPQFSIQEQDIYTPEQNEQLPVEESFYTGPPTEPTPSYQNNVMSQQVSEQVPSGGYEGISQVEEPTQPPQPLQQPEQNEQLSDHYGYNQDPEISIQSFDIPEEPVAPQPVPQSAPGSFPWEQQIPGIKKDAEVATQKMPPIDLSNLQPPPGLTNITGQTAPAPVSPPIQQQAPQQGAGFSIELAEFYAKLGQLEKAANVYRVMLSNDPNNQDLLTRLRTIESRLSNK